MPENSILEAELVLMIERHGWVKVLGTILKIYKQAAQPEVAGLDGTTEEVGN